MPYLYRYAQNRSKFVFIRQTISDMPYRLRFDVGHNELRRRSHHALAYFASHRCGPSSTPGLGRGRMCEEFHQLLAVGRWFPPGTPVSSTRKLISSSSFHRLDMTLAVTEALHPNKKKKKRTTFHNVPLY